MWPSWRERQVGRSPVAGSSRAFVGSFGTAHCSWSQAPSVSHWPAGRVFAKAASVRVKSAASFVRRRSTARRLKPPIDMCVCESMKPGTTRRHFPSSTTVFGPFQGSTSLFIPKATIRSPRTASASASGLPESPVQIFAESRMRSAGVSGEGAASRIAMASADNIFAFLTFWLRYAVDELPTFFSASEAWAAARRATATR